MGVALQIQISQPRAIQQHDLPLGLANKAENSLTMEL